MNKLERLKKIVGKDFADEFVKELGQYPTGLDDRVDVSLILPSGNFAVLDSPSLFTYDDSGSYADNRISWQPAGVMAIPEESDMWKCQNCGKVYRMKDALECKSCGSPITEGSRFVLER